MSPVRQRAARSPDSRGVKIWVGSQLSPAIARWLTETQKVDAVALRDLGLRDAEDSQIFFAARHNDAILMSKGRDFVELVHRHGSPDLTDFQVTPVMTSAEAAAEIAPRF